MGKILKIADPDYPLLLKEIDNPPQKLFYEGNISLLKKTCFAIVGTRKNTQYGAEITRQIVQHLSSFDFVIVSGLAFGIDALSHKYALEVGLPAIAVLGSNLKNIYPAENIPLAKKILNSGGLILSELSEDEGPRKFTFPLRNRIITGISTGVLVVEAGERSGALISASYALEQGRDIFVVPGDIDRVKSRGCLKLLQKGAAYPVSSGEDIIDFMRKDRSLFGTIPESAAVDSVQTKPSVKAQSFVAYKFTPTEKLIWEVMPGFRTVSLDYICDRLNILPQNILAALSLLEINGLIEVRNGEYRKL